MKTSDVYLGAALLSLKYKLENVDRTNPKHMIFEFSVPTLEGDVQPLPLREIENKWINRELRVNAFDFAEAIKRMKSVIHSS